MVTWHLTMKLFPAKCHERATLRKQWRQTGNSSLLPAKCWPLLHVIAGISARFSNFAFVLSLLCFEILGKQQQKIHCSPRDQSLSVKCKQWCYPLRVEGFIHAYRKKFIHVIRGLQFPTTFVSKNQNLKLNENRFQKLVQNCGMRYNWARNTTKTHL